MEWGFSVGISTVLGKCKVAHHCLVPWCQSCKIPHGYHRCENITECHFGGNKQHFFMKAKRKCNTFCNWTVQKISHIYGGFIQQIVAIMLIFWIQLRHCLIDSIAVPLFTNPNYSETSKLVQSNSMLNIFSE